LIFPSQAVSTPGGLGSKGVGQRGACFFAPLIAATQGRAVQCSHVFSALQCFKGFSTLQNTRTSPPILAGVNLERLTNIQLPKGEKKLFFAAFATLRETLNHPSVTIRVHPWFKNQRISVSRA
jgi:hypothetical protein